MRYAGIIKNDISGPPGVALSFFVQGCPLHCPGCHNPQTWSFNGGYEFTGDTMNSILEGLVANGVQRSLCIMGGEPMAEENMFLTHLVISEVKRALPDTKIYLWSGYTLEELEKRSDNRTAAILSSIDCIIDGPYIESERDITLPMRGSRNQRIHYLKEGKVYETI